MLPVDDPENPDEPRRSTRVWLVERTYSDDEQNLIILTYATTDGRYEFRKERALTSFTDDHRETRAAIDVSPGNLRRVTDEETVDRYSAAVGRTMEDYDRDDVI